MNNTMQSSNHLLLRLLVAFGALALIAAAIILYGSKDEKTPQKPVAIGFIGPLTGDAAKMGQNAQAAVALAAREVNAAGGINGRPLEVIYEDGQCNGADAARVANKFITEDHVPVILGGACSEETLAFTEVAEQSHTVVLSYCSNAPVLTRAGDYIFRDYPSDFFQGVFAADHLFETLGMRKVAVLYEQSDWGIGVKDAFSMHFTHLGSPVVVSEEGYAPAARDVRAQLLRIKAAEPQAVYFIGHTEASISGITLAKEFGLKALLFGTDRWDDAVLWRKVGSAGEGVSYAAVSALPDTEWSARLHAETGSDYLAACSSTAYDGLKLLAQVMERVGTGPEAIKNELYKVVYTGGVSSPKISFDGNGDLVGARYAVKTVRGGKAEAAK